MTLHFPNPRPTHRRPLPFTLLGYPLLSSFNPLCHGYPPDPAQQAQRQGETGAHGGRGEQCLTARTTWGLQTGEEAELSPLSPGEGATRRQHRGGGGADRKGRGMSRERTHGGEGFFAVLERGESEGGVTESLEPPSILLSGSGSSRDGHDRRRGTELRTRELSTPQLKGRP